MDSAPGQLEAWLAAARAGAPEQLGQALQSCRAYLMRIAQQELNQDLLAKGSASDLVQETFLEAHRDFARFRGKTEAELLAWLRQLLRNNIVNFVRHWKGTAKRQVGREVRLTAETPHSQGEPAASTPSPSEQVRQREELQQLMVVLDRLPAEYRQVIQLRNQARQSFEEIGRAMQRSADAARRLWARAVERLQAEWEQHHASGS